MVLQSTGLAQPPRRFERFLKRDSDVKYLVHVPQNYNPAKKYPLLIAVHRKGGPAIDQYDQWNFFSNRDGFILLCPQFFGGYQLFKSGEDRRLIAMLREMKDEFPYDEDRVFMVGFSVGGDFVQKFTFEHPGHIKGAAILSARNYLEAPYSGKARETWYLVTAGARDAQDVETARSVSASLNKNGYKAGYAEFPDLGHFLNNDVKNAAMYFFKAVK